MSDQTAKRVAYQIISAFDKSYRWFTRVTTGAQQRFEQCQWAASQQAIKERITVHEQALSEVVTDLYQQFHPHQQDKAFWQDLKDHYTKLLADHPQFELAETFFNSVIGRVFRHEKIDNDMMFVLPSRCYLPGPDRLKVINSFDTTGTALEMFRQIFATYHFNVPFDHVEFDLDNMNAELRKQLTPQQLATVHTCEILKPVFYRGKAAYLIGRICMHDNTLPFVIALQISDVRTLFVDALLMDRKDLSFIFSFARSYFMAETQNPAEVVAFLQELLPNKKHFELYMSLGFYKHGKTVFYRNFLEHLENSDDAFEPAPGIRGLVMTVFHLPSYGVVFKIIKDEFPDSKKITREHVKDCYRLVKTTDRVGRMADTHEYVNFRLPLARISDELMTELNEYCRNSIEIVNDELVIKHLYIERKMTPLNLFLKNETDPDKVRAAIDDLGLCIKQIAHANIFPGDMLHKNFGITKSGRVIFYDYDEICYMHERNFRELPQTDDPFVLDTLSVASSDVFPEQFEHFIIGKREHKNILKELHGDLMTAGYWKQVQRTVQNNTMQNFTPYNPSKRFDRLKKTA